MALFAEHVPEDGREPVRHIVNADFFGPFDKRRRTIARLAEARQVALDVGGKDRHAGIGEALGEALQRDRLARACGTCDEPVAVGEFEEQDFGLGAHPDQYFALSHSQYPLQKSTHSNQYKESPDPLAGNYKEAIHNLPDGGETGGALLDPP